MVRLWRCKIYGGPYVGDSPPPNCQFCGAHQNFIKEAKESDSQRLREIFGYLVQIETDHLQLSEERLR
jgi:hypothetical protein